jgi:inner membrane protein
MEKAVGPRFMDPVTHILSGAVAGLATAPKRPAVLSHRERVLVCSLAAAFPDIDILARLSDTLTYLNFHRGITHSLVMLPLWAWLLSWPLARLRRRERTVRDYYGIVALGLFVHILGDWITPWGTRLLAPLSAQTFSLNTTFIIDPVVTVLLAAGLAIAGIARMPGAARAGLLLVASYVGMQAYLRDGALAVARAYAAREAPAAAVHVLPQPFSPAHWRLLLEAPDFYQEADLDLWAEREKDVAPPEASLWRKIRSSYQPAQALRWRRIPRFGDGESAPFARAAWGADEFTAFRSFAAFPAVYEVVRSEAGNCAYFFDLRFSLNGRTPPFRFGACRQGNGWQLRPYVN